MPAPVVNSSLIGMSPVGRITWLAQRDARLVCGSSTSARSVSRARSAVAGESCLTRPPSSDWETSLRVWATHGKEAWIVALVTLTPGRISLENARVGGNAALSAENAALAL